MFKSELRARGRRPEMQGGLMSKNRCPALRRELSTETVTCALATEQCLNQGVFI